MVVVDIVILIFLAFGAIAGFKAGGLKKIVDFVGLILIVILSFYLKNYLSVLMYEKLPFFTFGGAIKGLEVLNVLLYEVIAFVIVFSILLIVLRVLLMITGIIEKVLKATIILSIPSKIIGLVVGTIEMYVYVFVILVVITLPIFKTYFLRDSKVANFMLNNTPVLSPMSDAIVTTYDDVNEIVENRDNKTDEEINTEVLKLLIKRDILTKESARRLVDDEKINIDDKTIIEEE